MASIEIDGSFGEGGGQIIRTCLSLSAITGEPFLISNIRAGRTKPGLQPQHLAAVKAAAAICAAEVKGAHVGSTVLEFVPKSSVQPGSYLFDIGTAGAATLVAQTVVLPLCLAGGNSKIDITGGTHVPHSPPAEYLGGVYLLALKEAGIPIRADYDRAGFYPKGGGSLHISVAAAGDIVPIALGERGKLLSMTAHIITSGLPDHVAQRGETAIRGFMKGIGRSVKVATHKKDSIGPGAAVVLVCQCEGGLAGFTSIGERGKPMEKVCEQACGEFMDWWKSGASVDEHLGDQLVLPAAIIIGESAWSVPRVTDHLTTVLWAVGKFLPIKSELKQNKGFSIIHIEGVKSPAR